MSTNLDKIYEYKNIYTNMIRSTTPDRVPNGYLWYDFSILNNSIGSRLSSVIDRFNNIELRCDGVGVAPLYENRAINGLRCAYFGDNINKRGYGNVLTTNFSGSTFSGITDSERTIFMVYASLDTSEFGDNVTTVDVSDTSFSYNNFYSGYFGCIMNIQSYCEYYINNSIESQLNKVSTWGGISNEQVSYLNLLKYQPGSGYDTVCNYMPTQGLIDNGFGYPVNNSNLSSKFTSRPVNIFSLRSTDNIKSFCEISNVNTVTKPIGGFVYNPELSGITSPTDKNVGYNGLYGGSLSLGNYSIYDNKYSNVITNRIDKSSIPDTSNTFGSGFKGYIGEFIYYNRRLTDMEYRMVKNYLSNKWNGKVKLQ